MNNKVERFYEQSRRSGIVPVVVLERVEDAVATAEALLMGGIDVMEITFRTAAAPKAIAEVSKHVPDMLVGAGTVITLEQCELAVECGAQFIVAPGYDEAVVSWCVSSGVPIVPGCVTPTEIMKAMNHDVTLIKFFPAGVYGGLSAMKALAAPFSGIRFVPTGGVNAKNIGEYLAAPYVHAVGGSWICTKVDIAEGNYDNITKLCQEARIAAFDAEHIA